MAVTRIFKSGNSLAVRIPKEFKLAREGAEVEIVEQGGSVIVREKTMSMHDLAEWLQANPTPLLVEALQRPEWPEHRLPPGADPNS